MVLYEGYRTVAKILDPAKVLLLGLPGVQRAPQHRTRRHRNPEGQAFESRALEFQPQRPKVAANQRLALLRLVRKPNEDHKVWEPF